MVSIRLTAERVINLLVMYESAVPTMNPSREFHPVNENAIDPTTPPAPEYASVLMRNMRSAESKSFRRLANRLFPKNRYTKTYL